MAFDLSRSANSKKNVDFADARYQLSEKLKQEEVKNVRATFTLYDNKEYDKTAVQDITAAYQLSDKKLPMGEVVSKMLDYVIDLEDGVLDGEKDAIYAWKFSLALLELFDDKSKRQEGLESFDNSLKAEIIASKTFQERFPGKYTPRTNFFDPAVKATMLEDIITVFRDDTVPKIHDAAKRQSDTTADKHNNPVLDRIIDWAVKQYNCHVDSFFQIKEDPETGLFYSVNTVIVHLKNGYDLSIIGYVGTDYDDKFSISVLDANQIAIKKHGEQLSSDDIKKAFTDTADSDAVAPLIDLLGIEKHKNQILRKQYEILTNTRPMIPANVLALKAAESVVGQDYIWGCETFRETHEDLPRNFKLEDLKLPRYVEKTTKLDVDKLQEQFDGFAETLDIVDETGEQSLPNITLPEALFVDKKKNKQDETGMSFNLPNVTVGHKEEPEVIQKSDDYGLASTLLPGVLPAVKEEDEVEVAESVTEKATEAPKVEEEKVLFKPIEKEAEEKPANTETTPVVAQETTLVLDSLESMFA